jgi:PKD repeat protein
MSLSPGFFGILKNSAKSILSSVYYHSLILFTLLFCYLPANAAPTVNVTVPASAFVNEVILVDARQSIGFSRLPQPDSSPSVVIDFGDGTTANLLATGHAYNAPGIYTITVTVKDSGGGVAISQRTINILSVPAATGSSLQIVLDAGSPSVNGANLQAAINIAANRNSVEQEIVLPAGAVFAGPIYLPTPVGNK